MSMKKTSFYNLFCLAILIFGCLFFTTGMRSYAMTDEAYQALVNRAALEGRNILEVKQFGRGGGCYNRIAEAVQAAAEGDIVLIYPGEYIESLDLSEKELILMGWDRNTCIIRFGTADYFHPVLNVSAGEFVNLTLIGVKEEGVESKLRSLRNETETGSEQTSLNAAEKNSGVALTPDCYPAYTVHIESDYEFGRNILFDNCEIVSENNFCVGLGTRGNSIVTFANCALKSYGMGGCVFAHDSVDPLYGGENTQLVFRNNRWENYGAPYLMSLYSYQPTNKIYTTFQDVKVFTYAVDKRASYHVGNLYTGADIEQSLGGRLADPLSLIYAVNKDISNGYLGGLKNGSTLKQEGIMYLQIKENQILRGVYTPQAEDDFLKICVFDIVNESGLPGVGFGGSENFILTADSYGNTLGDMNYGF